ncbi:EAL domain-containing protein [Limibaculum sp. M0105]|uniref:EAL domain-containing protein n=1 Tax=Thermohalobaculum xanthum TaxID=2753746 RepID=A0A8J7SDI3_9RHOB|nr:EAL domain-containing protein [Thermohalobaculum xanthum]
MQRIEEFLRRIGLRRRRQPVAPDPGLGIDAGTAEPITAEDQPPAQPARPAEPLRAADDLAAEMHGLVLLAIDDFASYEALFGDQAARGILHAIEERVLPALTAEAGFWNPGRGKLAISLPGADLDGIRMTARQLQRLVAQEGLATPAGRLFVTVSAGCAVADAEALPFLGPTAERALGDARRAGRGRCRIVPAARRDDAPDIGAAALRDLEAGRVTFAYQPVRRADQGGPSAFFECLARLPNEGAPPVEAVRFMSSLIEAGQAPVLDRLALERALLLMTVNPMARLSVNVSRQTMEDREWLGLLTGRSAVDLSLGDRLIVELTESDVLAVPAIAGGFLAAVRRCGVALALDRYGVAPMSAAELASFRVDIVKLAPELCHLIADAPGRHARLRERIALARAADLMVVATGIERADDSDWLREAGASHVQGRLIAAPDSAPDELSAPMAPRKLPARFSLYRG